MTDHVLQFLFVNKAAAFEIRSPEFNFGQGEVFAGDLFKMEVGAFAKLEGRNFKFFMDKRRILIGRHSKLGDVDIHMGTSKFVSRRHLEILLDRNAFFIFCRGKNGIFVDGTFQRRENGRLQLPTK